MSHTALRGLCFVCHHWLQLLFLLLLLGGSTTSLRAEEKWPPLPPEDLALEEHPEQPGSGAMVLLKTDFLDDSKEERLIFRRIKIFNEGGRKEADIEIPFLRRGQKIKNIAARVIRPDGEAIDYHGPIYEKTLVRARKEGVLVKAFALPQVEPGCIIEYRYRLEGDSSLLGGTWDVQEALFVKEARLGWIADLETSIGRWVPRNLPLGSSVGATGADLERGTLRNIPALEQEVFMPPMSTIRGHFRLKPIGMQFSPSYSKPFSELMLDAVQEFSDDFIGKSKKFKKIVDELISPADPEELKLQKLYSAVQERVHNLSYEESYTKKERKKEKLKERKSAKDVWKLGYGLEPEITQLFVSLCRAADFRADFALMISRDQKFFDPEMPLISQVTAPIAVVSTSKGLRFFDPGTRFCPFGRVSWQKQMVRGLRFLPHKRWEKFVIPLEPAEDNTTRRKVKMQLSEEGDLTAELNLEYSGQEAIRRKDFAAETSSEKLEASVMETVRAVFPTAEIEQVVWRGLDSASETLELSYTLRLQKYAIRAGPRLLIRPILFASRSPFPNQKRTHPVYFKYLSTKIDEILITLPKRYKLDHIPDRTTKATSSGVYELEITGREHEVSCRRKLALVDTPYLETNQYASIKGLYDAAQAFDQIHLIAIGGEDSSGGP